MGVGFLIGTTVATTAVAVNVGLIIYLGKGMYRDTKCLVKEIKNSKGRK